MAAKIKSGDLVKVIRGKDRGKEGTVKQVLKDDRLIVEGVQIVKKHVRATQQGQQAGGQGPGMASEGGDAVTQALAKA